jgi:hypothetical protein
LIKETSDLVSLIEKVKAMNGIKDVSWIEPIEVIGRNLGSFTILLDK